jgi:hypothetical protein
MSSHQYQQFPSSWIVSRVNSSSFCNEASRAKSGCAKALIVHVLLDVAVEEYTEWQQSRVSNEIFKDNINKARDVTLKIKSRAMRAA